MRTVLFACVDADTLGGIQRVTHTVAQGLAGRGYEVHVAGLHRSADPVRYVEHPAYEHHVLSTEPAGRSRSRAERRAITRLLADVGPCYVVMTSPGVVTRMRDLLTPHRDLGIGQYHGSFDHAVGSWHFRSVRAHYGELDQAVFLSADDARRFSEAALLPNACHLPNPLPGWPPTVSSVGGRRILGVGRLSGVKRFDRLISAFARACRSGGDPGWELHLIGDGPEVERLRLHAAAEGVASTVIFRGRIPAAGMPAEYLKASAVGLSSEHEGLPLVIGEAASYGVPCAAFDVSGGVRALVLPERTGLLVPPADVPALAAALSRLMGSADERRRLGAAARLHAERFRLEHVLDRWTSLLEHVSR
ncbi:glycosyltransferase [Microtetraspora sp. NBRC 16547]|uniref:glycosyltransferase n=1 Tax=Microtetraspora sp. NBRC 16547 TaxID=3030993 RepID=UPI0024A4C52A|nr:glycosyltransferase [Microtetraspora sp. NBRC 16547]GLW96234.1 glycosyl transferase [Microtetraspora sp. NBRC 16547]